MQTMNLSRTERRRRFAKTAKLYGIKGEKGLTVHYAYQALFKKDLERAMSLIVSISRSDPKNKHPGLFWAGPHWKRLKGPQQKCFLNRPAP